MRKKIIIAIFILILNTSQASAATFTWDENNDYWISDSSNQVWYGRYNIPESRKSDTYVFINGFWRSEKTGHLYSECPIPEEEELVYIFDVSSQ